jgi:predicted secreted protein
VGLLLLAACGGGAGQPQAPAAGHTVVLTEIDAGKSIAVHKGDQVEVRLQDSFPVPGSSTRWEATSSDSKVLRLVRSQHPQPTSIAHGKTDYVADFAADAAGTADVMIAGHNTCEAMNPAFCKDTQLPPITITVT